MPADPTPIPADESGRVRFACIKTSSIMDTDNLFPLSAVIGAGSAGIGAFTDFRSRLSLRPIHHHFRVAAEEAAARPEAEAVEVEVDHRGRVEREELAHEEPAHDGDAERAAQLRSFA